MLISGNAPKVKPAVLKNLQFGEGSHATVSKQAVERLNAIPVKGGLFATASNGQVVFTILRCSENVFNVNLPTHPQSKLLSQSATLDTQGQSKQSLSGALAFDDAFKMVDAYLEGRSDWQSTLTPYMFPRVDKAQIFTPPFEIMIQEGTDARPRPISEYTLQVTPKKFPAGALGGLLQNGASQKVHVVSSEVLRGLQVVSREKNMLGPERTFPGFAHVTVLGDGSFSLKLEALSGEPGEVTVQLNAKGEFVSGKRLAGGAQSPVTAEKALSMIAAGNQRYMIILSERYSK